MPETQELTYRHGDTTLTGQIARPVGDGPHPAVLVMHSALGLDDHMCRRAGGVADLGYIALATDMYGVGGMTLTRGEQGRHFMRLQKHPDLMRARVLAGFEAVRALPDVDGDRVSAIGFCFGGQCVLELARSGAPARSVVSFHGVLTTAQPAQPGAVSARILCITGAKDPYAPAADVASLQQEMTAAAADWQVTMYGAGFHAFTFPDIGEQNIPGVAYDPLLDRLSWAQATEFLAATLER